MNDRITVEELAELVRRTAGVTVSPEEFRQRGDFGFDTFGIDSLGLLGVVGELENRYGTPMPPDAERCRSPRQFLDLANSALMAQA
ncbi:acyl carrier protein [Streptomyces sp. NPDC052309]|uniref:acyl carrier protein n=1 Tax=Streptomyces sp. NPDC052309 TaxID=3155421 RepID=UPI0034281432